MCLIAFAFRQHPDYPLILVANRDEYYARPTRPAQFWEERPELLAGRDMMLGGTWLGINRNGRLAAVTNFREGEHDLPAPRSRGELPIQFLTGDAPPGEFVAGLEKKDKDFAGYNILVGDRQSMAYGTNRGQLCASLEPGCYALSNHLLNTPWPKVSAARGALEQLVQREVFRPQAVMDLLSSRDVYPERQLPDTGVSREWEQALSAAFVVSEDYGTRSTTLLLVETTGRVRFVEQNFLHGEPLGPAHHFRFFLRDC